MDFQSFHISELSGVGPAVAEKLARLGIETYQDLLFHLPYRYEDRTRIQPVAEATAGQTVQLLVTVQRAAITFGKKRSLVVEVADDTGRAELRFFYFSMAQKKRFVIGQRLLVFGEANLGRTGLSIIHPELKFLNAEQSVPLDQRLTPVYPVTDGVSQKLLRKLSDQVLKLLEQYAVEELLPLSLRPDIADLSLQTALQFVHRPPQGVDLATMQEGTHPAKQRLAVEELLAYQLAMQAARSKVVKHPAVAVNSAGKLARLLTQQLPFSLTSAQQRVVAEIEQDLKTPHPMLRLVQGDVGSGKTLVATLAALHLIEAGYQVALMAPTEILAEQHWNNLSEWFAPLDLECGFLVGKLTAAQRKPVLEGLANGEIPLVVGTHALFQGQVTFKRLALVIVDEQHRFGVAQRMALKDKGNPTGQVPHQLVMTATPIPRTLAMTAYADLDVSVIDELPPGRKPINTLVLPDTRREEVIQRVATACQQQGTQAYWVCTLIEESEQLQCQAAEDTAAELARQLTSLQVGLIHGRMKPVEKQAVMSAFQQGEIDLLVATTVIEVGVDVPNANLMVIENPERLGLAQLHQLRGRVGRGQASSHCVLMYKPELSARGRARLDVMRSTSDGFVIAEKDLELRGPGEVLGTRQTGLMQFKMADLMRDRELLDPVADVARQLYKQQPEIAVRLVRRWLGERPEYAEV